MLPVEQTICGDHLSSYAVDVNVLNQFRHLSKMVFTGYDLYPVEQFSDLLRSQF
nr:MAG TPA: hypothetical protein [Caudoviricetes sp.]